MLKIETLNINYQ